MARNPTTKTAPRKRKLGKAVQSLNRAENPPLQNGTGNTSNGQHEVHPALQPQQGPQIQLRTGELLQLPPRKRGAANQGLSFTRLFSKKEIHPYNGVNWTRALYKKQGFQREVEAPSFWAYNDVLITADKYLYGSRAGEPEYEDSIRHPIDRIANTYTIWGWEEGYFKTIEDAEIFNEELKAMQINQIWAPNSPVWFNIGHHEQWRWGRPDLRDRLKGGNKAYSTRAKVESGSETDIEVFEATPAEAPQASACFLTQVDDSMESILEHFLVEGRIFSSGSGVGINASTLRSSVEPIQGKGKSSGPISFDRGWDRSAGGIKSGGKTRRAARMVLLFSDHPDIFRFIRAKNDQEEIGKIILKEHNTLVRLKSIAQEKAQNGTPAEKVAANTILSLPEVNAIEYSPLMDDLLYGETLTHQNANHSVSLKGDFWKAYKAGDHYSTRWVTDPETIHETFPASKLMDAMCESAWANAEPGNHNNDWINLWNPVKTDGQITTSNPCSEYLHLNSTACNLSSFNAYRFLKPDRTFDAAALEQATRLAMVCADLNIQRGGFPIPQIAENTRRYRTTGIGFTNVGGTLMALGLAYDSDPGRFVAAQLVAALTSSCWKTSAELGSQLGSYEAYGRTKKDLRQVLNLHQAAFNQLQNLDGDSAQFSHGEDLPYAQGLAGIDALRALKQSFTSSEITPETLAITNELSNLTTQAFQVIRNAESFRNSFTTLSAPTGTISFPLGAYTLGTSSIEPDYSLVKIKSLAGGGVISMFNGMSLIALKNLGYSTEYIREAALEVAGVDGLLSACEDNPSAAAAHVLTQLDQPGPVRKALNSLVAANTTPKELFQMARGYEFPTDEHKLVAKGKNHMEQIPWLNPDHMAVFDCSATQGDGRRSIHILGHLRMLGAIQPFLSGASSKTCNLPYDATVEDFRDAYIASHEYGVKCIALYRADSKAISVFSTDTPEGKKYNANLIWQKLVRVQETAQSTRIQTVAPSQPKRQKLRGRRQAQTIKFQIQGLKGYLTVGTYPDGTCGEIFCRVGQSGTFASGILETWCKSISVMLQYRVPLDEIMEDFRSIAFEPSGWGVMGLDGEIEGNSKTISVSSIVDLIIKMLDYLFPASTGRKLQPVQVPEPTFPFVETLPIENGTLTLEPANPHPTLPNTDQDLPPAARTINFGGTLCPRCFQMSYVQDGKCKRCSNPSCGYKDGGCGD
jgi:ribonucleoside-diphosphate reductase alpha chain